MPNDESSARAVRIMRAMHDGGMMRLAAAAALALSTLLLCASAAQSAELVMFRRAGCQWCDAWDRDIGPIYVKTEVGRTTPIRFVDLDRDAAMARLARPVRFTPTFVLVESGQEIGRIEGYPGQDFFWGLLDRLVLRLPAPPASPTRGTPVVETTGRDGK
jgi:hypothetical protein